MGLLSMNYNIIVHIQRQQTHTYLVFPSAEKCIQLNRVEEMLCELNSLDSVLIYCIKLSEIYASADDVFSSQSIA